MKDFKFQYVIIFIFILIECTAIYLFIKGDSNVKQLILITLSSILGIIGQKISIKKK